MIKNKIYKLNNQIKHYEWGSLTLMPEFLGISNPRGEPFAEMWMGTHKSAPSCIVKDEKDTKKIPLNEVTGELPFLFKLLAVEKPLSIQAHPDKEKARQGFLLEEEAGVDLKSPMRNYKDPNHKPELLCAITKFSFMAGFRTIESIKKSLDDFVSVFPQLKEIISPLQRALNTDSLAVFLRILFDLTELEKEYISELIRNNDVSAKSSVILAEQWALMKEFACQYPQDPAIISPLYLNYITLQPGQAVYLPSGILHSYIKGFAVELMTASDNVLRGGLTPKYIDIPELMNILDFKPHVPKIYSPVFSSWFCYGSEDFSLATMEGDGQQRVFPGKGPVICLVTNGELIIDNFTFKKGESFFISEITEEIKISGKFTSFFAASSST